MKIIIIFLKINNNYGSDVGINNINNNDKAMSKKLLSKANINYYVNKFYGRLLTWEKESVQSE